MKAIQSNLPATLESLMLADVPNAPAPGPGEISVRIYASSLNFHDYAVVKGLIPTPDKLIPMSDGAGEVIATGEGVTEFAVGDNVISMFFTDWEEGRPPMTGFTTVPGDGVDGFAREAITAPTNWFTHAPHGYSHAEAATLPCAALTAWRGLIVEGGLKAGDTVLVQGSGGVSIFALQFAKAMGARVIATSSSNEKLERLKALGADDLINYKETPEWGAAVLGLTGGVGVDHVVEVGGAGTLEQSMIAARLGGHISMIGVLAGFAGPVMTMPLMVRHLRVIGISVGSRQQQRDMVAAINMIGIRPVMDKHFPLAQLADAFRYQETGAHFGKIIVDI
jgi:NADPH:quinone reductase-like Zn-dependent oxidoreductase